MDPHSTGDLFSDEALQQPARREQIGEQSYVLRGYALPWLERLLPELRAVLAQSPFRQMVTPGGFTMSAALSSCGDLGWTTDRQGYRYSPIDPERHQPWPALPNVLRELEITTSSSPLIACPLWVETYHDLISPPEEVKIIIKNLKTRHTVLGYSGLALMVLLLLCVCGMLIFAVTEYPKADLLKMPPKERSHQ